jgi:hypothetical protein
MAFVLIEVKSLKLYLCAVSVRAGEQRRNVMRFAPAHWTELSCTATVLLVAEVCLSEYRIVQLMAHLCSGALGSAENALFDLSLSYIQGDLPLVSTDVKNLLLSLTGFVV